ncbi:hypothetical protein GO730_37390 [Spirosoma sp. HMF3257]|uniref:HTH LytTR-type domain-containing protein n=1 Tax=Spirosoma telluris TaxID=2183553 RepID=A0A327NGJ4_9BACT|nr:hypothetical protein [Spirosoma telluris]RAI73066.1 hypothetical protein HMF3257_37315 [Spirosoma telluris]
MKRRLTGQHGSNDFDRQSVLYLRGDVNYSRVHLQTGQILVSSRTLKWYADRWPDFVRVHKGALVNPAYAGQVKLTSSQRSLSY